MTSDQHELWDRIAAFELDDPAASLTFTRRLARENGWTHDFALRVVEEYKRFAFLAMTAGHEVTPSDEVDQAWHLHLTYTRSYWDEFCGEVLRAPLHHGPTKGGKAEGVRFEDQYERTLASYRAAFDDEPPADIWPPAEARFREATGWVRINRSRAWVVPKPWRRRKPVTAMAGLVGLGVLAPLAALNVALVLTVALVLFAAIPILIVIGRSMPQHRNKTQSGGDSGCGAHGAMFFGGGGGDGADSGGDAGGGGDSGCGGGGCGGGGCGGCGG